MGGKTRRKRRFPKMGYIGECLGVRKIKRGSLYVFILFFNKHLLKKREGFHAHFQGGADLWELSKGKGEAGKAPGCTL